jgi:hypothetical protein
MVFETVLSESPQAQAHFLPLGSFEELLWQMDKRSPLHACLVAHVDGSTTIGGWRCALEQTRQRHPLWSVVIVETDDGRASFQQMQDPRIALRVIEGDFADDWQNEVALELSYPIDSEHGPLVRAVLMHTDTCCMLILSAHHSICDGMSLAFAMRDVLLALSGSALRSLSLHDSQEDTLGVFPEYDTEKLAELLAAPTVYRSKSSILPQVRSLEFPRSLTEVLRRRAREERTTVHAALVAASGIAARRVHGYGAGRDLHLCSTISNRAFAGSPQDFGVFFTACDFLLEGGAVDDLWELARRSKDVLRMGQREDGAHAALGAIHGIVESGMDAYTTGEQGGKLFSFDIHVSNLGVVPIATDYGAISLRQLWGPAVLLGFEGEQTLGVSTLNERLCLLHTSHDPLPGFLDQIQSIVTSGCDS